MREDTHSLDGRVATTNGDKGLDHNNNVDDSHTTNTASWSLDLWEKHTATSALTAQVRRHLVLHEQTSLAAVVLCWLEPAVRDFVALVRQPVQPTSTRSPWRLHPTTRRLQRVLQWHNRCAAGDPTLAEEFAHFGTHRELVRLIQVVAREDDVSEDDQDTLVEIQDDACFVATTGDFPRPVTPLTLEELRHRLPLPFAVECRATLDAAKEELLSSPVAVIPVEDDEEVDSSMRDTKRVIHHQSSIWINQVTKRQSAQQDVGYVLWPSAVALSHWLMAHPSIVQNATTILELGAGCGLTGLVAARLRQIYDHAGDAAGGVYRLGTAQDTTPPPPTVLLSDFNRNVLENLEYNIRLNAVEDNCGVVGLDFYQQRDPCASTEEEGEDTAGWIDVDGNRRPPVDVILAADVICQPSDAVAAANTLYQALRPDGRAYVVCANAAHRFGVDDLVDQCHRVGLHVQCDNVGDLHNGAFLHTADLMQTSGYVESMKLTMFTIRHESAATGELVDQPVLTECKNSCPTVATPSPLGHLIECE